MPAICVIGSQWGDEGKGKVVDILGENADYVVRYQGGNNAGHTVIIDDKKYTFHALPAGVLRGIRSLVASEVVLDPRQLVKEIESLGMEVDLGIDPRTSIIMPWHNDLDIAREKARKKQTGAEIGTTARGIGPCYEDDKNRSGIRFFELVGDTGRLEERIRQQYVTKKELLKLYGEKPSQKLNDIIIEYTLLGDQLKDYLSDVSLEVHHAVRMDRNIIFEGAQGTLLDIKFGNYPKVTSSHPMSGSIFDSVGIPPMSLRTIGIAKAYVTKVGSGPVVTCLDKGLWPVDETKSPPFANYIREKGKERGTTTGRPRRVGWMDLMALEYTHRINGFSELALMKLDCLAGLANIALATGYTHKGERLEFGDYRSWDLEFLSECEGYYELFDGFGDISDVKKYRQLPKNAKKFIEKIEDKLELPITLISVGPKRDQIINRGFKKFK